MTPAALRQTMQELAGAALGSPPLSPAIANANLDKVFEVIIDEMDLQESFATETLAIEDSLVLLPADFARMIEASYEDATLRRVDPERLVIEAERGLCYAPWGIRTGEDRGRKLLKVAGGATGSLVVYYRRYPAAMASLGSNDEIVDIPREMHLPAAYEGAWMYLSRQGSKNLKDFNGYHQYFREELGRLARKLNQQWSTDSHHQVQMVWDNAFQ